MALQSLPGESEVHYINTEIPHQQGDYIPSATITKYRVGHYKMQENGMFLMESAGAGVDDETPSAWVIPGIIEVDVPPPQMNPLENEITQNGVYNLVDTDDNPEDIEIEPDDNRNSRGILIKSNKTMKTVKLEKTRDIGDEEGEEEQEDQAEDTRLSLGQIRVNVQPKILIDEIRAGYLESPFPFSGFQRLTHTDEIYSLPGHQILLLIVKHEFKVYFTAFHNTATSTNLEFDYDIQNYNGYVQLIDVDEWDNNYKGKFAFYSNGHRVFNLNNFLVNNYDPSTENPVTINDQFFYRANSTIKVIFDTYNPYGFLDFVGFQ